MSKDKSAVQDAAGTELVFQIPNTESLGKLKALNPQFSLTMKYKSADDWAQLKDKPLRAFYLGQKDVPNEDGEMVKCALFATENEVFISGQMILVEAVNRLSIQTPVEIIYRGKKPNKSSNGQTMMFDIQTLA